MTGAGPLLVPVQLDAFVVMKNTGVTIRRPTMDYESVKSFGSPEQDPFAGADDSFAGEPENWGVYLMWTLPAALRHGVQTPSGSGPASGKLEFPPVPNRWLVARTLVPPEGEETTTARIVESDYLDDKATSPYADPTAKDLTPTRIGRKIELSEKTRWSERDAGPAFLRAVGPGDPAFSVFQPNNEDVFSIHDDLAGIDSGTLHYFVAGWHTASDQDPLAGWSAGDPAGFAALLDRLGWTALAEKDTRTASTSLYHGLLLGVDWNSDGDAPRSAAELNESKLKVAVGNTSIDALKAFLKAGGLDDSSAQLIEAFGLDQLGVLEQPGGDAILERRLHSSWFASGDGGVRWQIVDRPTKQGEAPPAPPTAEELTAEEAWLARLNAAQAALDAMRRELAACRREVYELWWKRGYASARSRPSGAPSDAQLQAALDPAGAGPAGRVKQLAAQVASMQEVLPAATPDGAGIAPDAYAAANSLSKTRQLVAGLAPRFFGAQDPVLLVAGLGHDLPIDPTAKLACRFTGETVTVVAGASGGRDVAVDADVPPGTEALLQEFVLLEALYARDPDAFAPHQDAVVGKLPSLPLQRWRQPWLPLYLEWEATWYPLRYEVNGATQWTFDQDFAYAGPKTASPSQQPLTGRALLTPGLAFAFHSRLEQYIKGNPASAQIQALESHLGTITDWDFLSQTLDGLMTQLALRSPKANRAPDASIAELVGDEHREPPQPLSLPDAHAGHHGLQKTAPTFEGMRAGQLALTRVSIVDRFGQTVDVPLGNDAVTPPAVADGLVPAAAHRVADGVCAELPPRLLQRARLRFTPVSPADDKSELDVVDWANPLCGFLVPDHIDRGLAAHDPAGKLLGELSLGATADDGSRVEWTPAPTAAAATLEELEESEPTLSAVLGAVIKAGPGAFQNFVTAIDETLWTIDPLAADADDYVTALAGRALALVRAKLALELDGPPVRDPSWQLTLAPVDPPFLHYSFPVGLGSPADREDGLVGYFVEQTYEQFHAVHVPHAADAVADPTVFVRSASPHDILLSFDRASAAHVTLLVDPRGEVQAHTGLLPTTVLQLPGTFLAPAIAGLSVGFRAGPLLAETGSAPVMPTPTASKREWSWVEPNGFAAAPAAFSAVDASARFSTLAPTAREGYVQVDPPGGDQ